MTLHRLGCAEPSSGGGGERPLVLARDAARNDLRDAFLPHRHAVQRVGRLHRALLVRDDDELRAVGIGAEEGDEAADVRIVEGGLDLVQEVERARPGEEEREQERDRAEGPLAAGEERQARDRACRQAGARPRRRAPPPPRSRDRARSDGGGPRRRGTASPRPPRSARARGRTSRSKRRSTVSASSGAQLLELLEALLEILALRDQLLDALLLALVLLLGEWIDLAERLAAPAELIQRRASSSSRPSPSAGSAAAASSRRVASRRSAAMVASSTSIDARRVPAASPASRRRSASAAPSSRSSSRQLAGPRAARIGARAERRLEPFRSPPRGRRARSCAR